MDYMDESAVKPIKAFRKGSSFQRSGALAVIVSSLLSVLAAFCLIPVAQAAPVGGNIVGGSGSINTNGLNTTIRQNTQSQVINWNSYNVKANETVNYLQPNASAISLNRILGNNASQIFGQINANGQVVLVNPNGIFFGNTASVNVGGLIASGLDISPSDFMNGDYFFNEVIGSEGSIINSGLINASLGGNVALIGKQVSNEGVISAQLGSISLAAGKTAVLTFDQQGLLGVQVTEAILQDELGVDPAVINSGDIRAKGGRVLLTGSTSQDVFSQAVNSGDIEQATSVVVHEDGTFTLGAGADVVNSGSIDVSSIEDNGAGGVVILGENIEHSGSIQADSTTGSAGMIELHAVDTTELKGQATISAKAGNIGTGGQIKILGEKVGLLDNSEVNASGANGGGELLIGGDREGLNSAIRNAEFVYLGSGSNAFADALFTGDGGKIITYANDTARVYGGLFARGGSLAGNGGFIETSGKRGFSIAVVPDVSASNGLGGLWLIDPYDITIEDTNTANIDTSTGANPTIYTPSNTGTDSTITVDTIRGGLNNGSVEIKTTASGSGQNGDIIFDAILDYNGRGDYNNTGENSLTLNAYHDIEFTSNNGILDSDYSGDSLNINLYANGSVKIGNDSYIDLRGGDFTVGGEGGNTPTSYTNNGTIDTSSGNGGGDITITTTTGDVRLGGLWVNDDDSWSEISDTTQIDPGGNITVNAGNDIYFDRGYNYNSTMGGLNNTGGYSSPTVPSIKLNAKNSIYINAGIFDTIGTSWDTQNIVLNANHDDIGGGNVSINADIYTGGGSFTASGVNFSSAGHIINTDYNRSEFGADSTTSPGGDVSLTMTGIATLGDIITETLSTSQTDIANDIYASCGTGVNDACGSLTVIAGGTIANNANNTLSIHGISTFTSNTPSSITLDQDNDFVGQVNVTKAQNLTLKDSSSLTLGNIDIAGALSVTATGGGITQATGTRVAVDSTSSFITSNSNSDITLNSASNDFLGAVSFSNQGDAQADIVFNNSSSTTEIGNVTVYGDLTVNAQGSLTLSGNDIHGHSDLSHGDYTTSLDFNFGLNDSDATFQLSAGSHINSTTGKGDSVNITIDGGTDNTNGTGDNTFKFISTSSISVNGTLTINGNSGADSFEIGTSLSGSVNGAAGNDTFSVRSNSINVSNIYGGAGSDTLIGSDNTNIWNITGSDSGNLNTNNVSDFQQIENLTGGSVADTFYISNGGDVTGLIDGWSDGAAGTTNDTVNLTAKSTAVTVQLDASLSTLTANVFDITNIETLTANSSKGNTLLGGDTANIWRIDGADDGAVSSTYNLATNSIPVDNKEGVIKFTNFENLTGGTGTDNFIIEDAGDVTGLIDGWSDGAAGSTNDTVNLTAKLTAVTVQLDASLSTLTANVFDIINIETLTANSSNANTLLGGDTANIWRIDGTDGGAVSSTYNLATNSIPAGNKELVTKFTNFETLTGGTNTDNFIIEDSGKVTGSIDGGSGAGVIDKITNVRTLTTHWAISGANQGTVKDTDNTTQLFSFSGIENLTGATDVADIYHAEDTFTFTGNIDGGAGTGDEIINEWSTVTNWYINGNESGKMNSFDSFSGIETLTGSNKVADTFYIQDTGIFSGTVTAGSGAGDELINGRTATTHWKITGSAQAAVKDVDNTTVLLAVSGVEKISGANDVADIFHAVDSVTFNGSIDGGTGAGDEIINEWFTATNWYIDGNESGSMNSFDSFSNIETLTGSDAVVDTFYIQDGGVFSGSIAGGTDAGNTITNQRTTKTIWNITSTNGGELQDKTTATIVKEFSDIDSLNGSGADDDFIFGSLGSVNSIVGGGGANSIQGPSTKNFWTLTNVYTGTLKDGSDTLLAGFQDIQTLKGGSSITDSLTGWNSANTWTFDGALQGHVEVTIDNSGPTNFTSMGSVTGGNLNDAFDVTADYGDLSINGGGGTNSFIFSKTDGSENAWTVDSSISGTITAATKTYTFNNISSIKGNGDPDTFTISNTSFIGKINGGLEDNTSDNQDEVSFAGLGTAYTYVMGSEPGFVNIERYGGCDQCTLEGSATGSTWNIDGVGAGTLDGARFSGFGNLLGGDGNDIFNFIGSGVGTPVYGQIDGVLEGGSGSDTINLFTAANLLDGVAPKAVTVQIDGNRDPDNLTNGWIDVSGFETINANASIDNTLRGFDLSHTWNATTTDEGTVDGTIAYTGFSSLTGGSASDTLVYAMSSAANWIISDVGKGTINAAFNFDGMENLTGVDGVNDIFKVYEGGQITGDLVGGTGGGNQLVYTGTSDWAWTISAPDEGSSTGIAHFTGIGTLTGSDNATDTFTLNSTGNISIAVNGGTSADDELISQANSTTNWIISSANNGSMDAVPSFTGIENLTGSNSAADIFTVAEGAGVSRVVTGGTSSGDTLAYSGTSTVWYWNVDTLNGGSTTGVTQFVGIESLTGSDDTLDHFTFTEVGSITGVINGGSVIGDTLAYTGKSNWAWTISSLDTGSTTGINSFVGFETLTGSNNAVDTFTLAATGGITTEINGGSGTGDELISERTVTTSWAINSDNGGTVDGVGLFTSIEKLTGSSADDNFTIVLSASIGTIDGAEGTNKLTGPNQGNDWTLTSATDGTLFDRNTSPKQLASFTNIQVIVGGSATDYLTAFDDINTWSLNSTDYRITDSVGTRLFSSMEYLIGGALDDSFQISVDVGNLDISGGNESGKDSFVFSVDDTNENLWTVNGANSGTLEAGGFIYTFREMESLKGSIKDPDSFDITSVSFISNINGGNDDNLIDNLDSVDFSSILTPFTVIMGNNAGFVNIDSYLGGSQSTLQGSNSGSTWNITGDNSGTVGGFSFSGFATLVGGSGDDTFNFQGSGASTPVYGDITGLINGGDGNDVINFYTPANLSGAAAAQSVVVEIDGTATPNKLINGHFDITGFEHVNSNNSVTNTLQGYNIGHLWTVTSVSSGNIDGTTSYSGFDSLTGGTGVDELINGTEANGFWAINDFDKGTFNTVVSFASMEKLTGAGDYNDTFTVADGGSISGEVKGGAGGNDQVLSTLTASTAWNITGTNAVTVSSTRFTGIESLKGSDSQTDTFNLQGTNANLIIDGGVNTNDEIASELIATTDWTISGPNPNSGSVSGNTFSDIENLTGADNVDDNFTVGDDGSISGEVKGGAGTVTDQVINTRAASTDWYITGTDVVTVSSSYFTSVEKLSGSDNVVDKFYLGATGGITGSIDGGLLSDDEIISQRTTSTTWNITNANVGNVTGIAKFSDIENLTGNNQNDTFNYKENASSISGMVDGGFLSVSESDSDFVDMSFMTNSIIVNLQDDFSNIERFKANGNAELIGRNTNNFWRIYNLSDPDINNPKVIVSNQGTVKDGDNFTSQFEGFNNITGGTLADNFLIEANGDIDGDIDGGTHPLDLDNNPYAIDTIDFSSQAVVDKTVATALDGVSGIRNIEGINGNGTASILRASDSGSTWIITGNNSGSVTSGTSSTSFTNFNILQGGAGVDNFEIRASGSIGSQTDADIVSRINGGAGDDKVTVNLNGDNAIIALFNGNGEVSSTGGTLAFANNSSSDSDTLIINGSIANFETATYSVDYVSKIATHLYENTTIPALASVSYTGVESVTDTVQAGNLVISGQDDNDQVTLSSDGSVGKGEFVVKNSSFQFISVAYENKTSLTVGNLGASGLITISNDFNLNTGSGFFSLSAHQIDNSGGYTLTGHSLNLDSIGVDNTTGNKLLTNVAQLSVTNSNAKIEIDEKDAISLLQTDSNDKLTVVSGGSISDTSTQALVSSGDLDLQANGSILLENSNNALTGLISFDTNSSGAVVFNNSGTSSETRLGIVDAGIYDLTVTSSNAPIVGNNKLIANNVNLGSGSYDISLLNSSNNFGSLSIGSAANVKISDFDTIQLRDIRMVGFVLNSVGVSQQTGTTLIQQSPTSGPAQDIIFNAGASSIVLGQAGNQFLGPVSLNNSGNNEVTITDTDNLVFGESHIGSGIFKVDATGIKQSGPIIQQANAAAVTINAGAGAIDLTDSGNDFSGEISLSNSEVFDVNFTNSNVIHISSASVKGTLNVISLGAYDLTQSGAISVDGATNFRVADGQSVLLNNPGNNFQNTVDVKSNSGGELQNVDITNIATLNLAALNLAGDLNIDALEASQSGVWTVAGDTIIDSTGEDVKLSTFTNDLNQIAFVDAKDVSLTDSNGVILGTNTYQSSIAGSFSVTTQSGDITENSTSSIKVDGTTILNAGSGKGNVVLGVATNDLNIVTVSKAQDVTLADANQITVNSTTINGDLDVTAVGSIDDGENGLSVAGLTLLTTTSGNDITLDNSGNRLNGQVSLNASSGSLGDVLVTNSVNTDLGGFQANNLNIFSSGNISQQGGFIVNGETRLTANSASFGPQDILLSGADANSLNQLWVENAHDVTIDNSGNDLTINKMNASGFIDITSRNLTSNIALSTSGITFNASGTATFNSSVNSTAGVDISAGGLQLNGQVTAVDDLLLTTVNNGIDQNANLTSSSGSVVLNSAADILMSDSTSTIANSGDINYTAQSNIGLELLSAPNHSISLESTNGAIGDSNGAANNLLADSLTIRSNSGIASEAQKLNTQVALMDVVNTGAGSIFIDQIGTLEIDKLQATVGSSEIFLESNTDIIVNKGSVAVNRDNGKLRMNSENGSFYGEKTIDYTNPNITANTATFFAVNGTFGSTSKPIVFDVPQSGAIFIDAKTNSIFFHPEQPDNLKTTGLDISSLGVIQAISGEQLVEIESLGDIDPAIFTELRNYSSVDISIRMPRDQLYDDELREDDQEEDTTVSVAF